MVQEINFTEKDLKRLKELVQKIEDKGTPEKKKRKWVNVRRPFSVRQLKKIFSNIGNCKLTVICFLALRTGMRLNEVLSTTLEEIDWDLKQIHKKVTKGGKPRTYYLDNETISILKKWVSLLGDTGWLFPSEQGNNRCHNQGIYGEFVKVLKKSDLWIEEKTEGKFKQHRYVFHSFRSTFCSLLVNSRVPVFVAKELMGHGKVSTTERHYVLMGDRTLKGEIDRVFGSGRNKLNKTWEKEKLDQKEDYIENFNRQFEDKETSNLPQRDPLNELQLRLVRGEITVEEFNLKSKLILDLRK